MDWGSIISAGASLVGSLISKDSADNASDKAVQTTEAATALAAQRASKVDEAVNKLMSLTPPNLQDYIKPYARQVIAGEITPEQFTSQVQKDTALAGITVPPALLAAQQNALSQLQNIASSGGLTAIDRAQLNDIQQQQANRSAAEQAAIIDNAQQRGISGSGLELQARLISQQNAANQGSANGMQVAANAQQRALQAIRDSASQAGQMRDQDYAQQANAAKAQDLINNFNTTLGNSTAAANTSARNAAQAANLGNAQSVSNYNAQQSQLEQAAKQAAAQQQWLNTYNQTNAAAATTAGLANAAATNQLATQSQANGLQTQANAGNAAAIQQLGNAGTSLVNAYNSSNKKTTTDEPYPGYNASVGL